MRRLIEDLLDLSRTRFHGTQPRKRPLDLAQLVEQVVETVRPAIEARRHALEIALPPGPTIIEADPARLAQVLTNLLENAAKYTDPGGQIGLTAKREGGDILLRVWDTGIGIVPEIIPHVFDLYWQSSRAAEHTQGGLGKAAVRADRGVLPAG
jgi:signal transduction histidine kinase